MMTRTKYDPQTIAEELVKMVRECRLGVSQKQHDYNFDNSEFVCVRELQRELQKAFDLGADEGFRKGMDSAAAEQQEDSARALTDVGR